MPSLSHWYAKTMATSVVLASAAAAAGSSPELYFTVALGARAWMALSGEVGNQKQHIGGEWQHRGMGIESQKECEEPGGQKAFPRRPSGFGGCIGEDAGDGGVESSGDAQYGADGGAPQQVHGRDKRWFIEPDIAVNYGSAFHLKGDRERQGFSLPQDPRVGQVGGEEDGEECDEK